MIYIITKQSHFVYPMGKLIMPHLRRYQGFAVVHYSVTLDALYSGHPSKGGSPTSTFDQLGCNKQYVKIEDINSIPMLAF